MNAVSAPMRRLQPPLHLLRAFATVVRFGGVSRAAEALHLTQSAVSKQVQELEQWVGVPLFERVRKRLALTPAGERYAAAVRGVLGQIEAATLELITSSAQVGVLHISSMPTFGAKWLIPRLPAFQASEPGITLHFVPYVRGYDFSMPELDGSIRFGDGHWPGARAHYLAGRQVALIAPVAEAGLLRAPADVARFTLLQHVSVPQAWMLWHQAHGVAAGVPDLLAGPQFDQFQTMIRAVMAGMGVALVPRCLVADEIAAGLVAEPLPQAGYRSPLGYWFCYPEARARLQPLQKLRDWLLTHAEDVVSVDAPASAGGGNLVAGG